MVRHDRPLIVAHVCSMARGWGQRHGVMTGDVLARAVVTMFFVQQ